MSGAHSPEAQASMLNAMPQPLLGVQDKSPTLNSPSPGTVRRPSADNVEPEDGPLFRATLNNLESKTATFKLSVKRLLKAAMASYEAQRASIAADDEFLKAIRGTTAADPLVTHYLDAVAGIVQAQRKMQNEKMQTMLLEPLRQLYETDIKPAESKKKQFEDESKDYYAFLHKYLGMRTDSAKAKKTAENEQKYNAKRKNFDLVRFDYHTYMQDLHGGRKEQEVLYHLTNHFEKQYDFFQTVAAAVGKYKPGLEKVHEEMLEATKEIYQLKKDRSERRKTLECRPINVTEMQAEDGNRASSLSPVFQGSAGDRGNTGSAERTPSPSAKPTVLPPLSTSPVHLALIVDTKDFPVPNQPQQPATPVTPQQPNSQRFQGFRDLQEQDHQLISRMGHRKEGFLFATSKPSKGTPNAPFDVGSLVWHKYWCVVAGGYLHEYSNWKKQLETHGEPINLRFATVREARNADRRFLFEVITPQFRRLYQATSNEDMQSWIGTICNAIESVLGEKTTQRPDETDDYPTKPLRPKAKTISKGLRLVMSGGTNREVAHLSEALDATQLAPKANGGGVKKSVPTKNPTPQPPSLLSSEQLLESLRSDVSNCYCADCGLKDPEWVSLNLGVLICIECSGIHRSLGTHISKVRSLTLDTTSFLPDLVEMIQQLGNARSNQIWEATLTSTSVPPKPQPSEGREAKQKFIQAKYVDRLFIIAQDNPSQSLFEAIRNQNIPQAMQAIASGAKLNEPINHSSPPTPSRAASNGSPPPYSTAPRAETYFPSGGGADDQASLSTSSTQPASPLYPISLALLTDQKKPFPMAELLYLNGADPMITDGERTVYDIIVEQARDKDVIAFLDERNARKGIHVVPQ
ncbi:hypothetical protein BZG36_00070 [Bifiguratus adelaidae]|uniref:Arf-GAP domain-containing protein n=1 Tax=Bifiguratus adelaidae TaxID=1938954 RepID=A0A261Y8N9_9FUNG|nr:hypothetical protein BZG36_00070 [Bifiguratus adelaidae]